MESQLLKLSPLVKCNKMEVEGRAFGGQVASPLDWHRDICNYKAARAAKKKCRLDGSPKMKERNGSLRPGVQILGSLSFLNSLILQDQQNQNFPFARGKQPNLKIM